MNDFIKLTDNEILMGFVASCIESVAKATNKDYVDIYRRMDAVGMIDRYIIPHYDTLHTESRSNLTESLIETLERWEEQHDSISRRH